MNRPKQAKRFPEGLEHAHLIGNGLLGRHASPVSVILLGALLVAALAGFFGGGPRPVFSAASDEATLSVKTPDVIRTGMYFETEIAITPKRPVADLTLAVTPSLWRDFTQNTMIPAAAEESFENGFFRYSYGPAEAGKPLVVKIDFQINPSMVGTNRGVVALFDGDTELLRLPLETVVRP